MIKCKMTCLLGVSIMLMARHMLVSSKKNGYAD